MTLATGSNVSIALAGLESLWSETLGDPRICLAVLDGPVDRSHPCFDGANLTRLPTLVADEAGSGIMSGHGTHITSVIFGQHGSPVQGIAPNCRGLIVPVFTDDRRRGKLSQLDLARAINQAVEAGANVINISGGELSEADPMLVKAVQFCNDEGVLIVAAAGNDSCECLHVPAALPSVLAVGAANAQGLPFDFSNWGKIYQNQGILAPGENILGAESGGGTALRSGTSFATPIVSGIVALLLSIQLKRGENPNPHAIRDALLKSALPCNPEIIPDCRRFLAGSLNIPGAYALISEGGESVVDEKTTAAAVEPSEAVNTNQEASEQPNPKVDIPQNITEIPQNIDAIDLYLEEPVPQPTLLGVQAAEVTTSKITPNSIQNPGDTMTVTSNPAATSSVTPSSVVPLEHCGCENGTSSLVYALGTIGYDFGTEARRDSFKQLMDAVRSDTGEISDGTDLPSGVYMVPPNPYDARQMANYLRGPFDADGNPQYHNISEAASLIWTLNLELTPIYAIEPKDPFASSVYKELADFLAGQVLAEEDRGYIERVSIPGVLSGRTVALFSGQVLPVIEPLNTRGMYAWTVNALIEQVMSAISNQDPPPELTPQQEEEIEYSLRNFLMRIYYDLRNLGQTSAERAQNFASTNVFQYADSLVSVLANQSRSWAVSGDPKAVTMQLDDIRVERSPFCRKDSDCWDVRIVFFDPENDRRAKRVLRYTVDVSDMMPVTLGKPRVWDIAN